MQLWRCGCGRTEAAADPADRLCGKLSELTAKRNELVARAKLAEAQTRVHDAVRSIDHSGQQGERYHPIGPPRRFAS